MSTLEPGLDEKNERDFALDPFRLRFRDPAIERTFLDVTLRQSINFIRAYLIAGLLLYSFFSILDVVTADPALPALLFIRFGIVCPYLIGIFALTFFPLFFRVAQAALAGVMLLAGLGIVAMTAIMSPPFNVDYYAGLILVIVYSSSLSRLKFTHAVAISMFLIFSYQVVCLLINPLPLNSYLSNNFFLTVAMGLGLFSAHIVELYIRRSFAGQQIVEDKNKVISKSLTEAVSANKSKSEFLATMSHELRTPLNAIIGFSDIIHKQLFGPVGNERYADYAKDIHASGSHLLSIINDILDLAKAESGKLELSEHAFDLTGTIEACVRMCGGRAESNKVDLIFFGGQSEIIVRADERLILQIAANIVSNAIKFTPEGGKVRIHLTADAHKGIVIKVADTGIGIASEDLERVLRPFEQVESSYARKHNGSGLGLPYAKRLTELHGGELKLESELGKGTTVTILLPASRLIGVRMAQPLKEAG
jgi:two-component system, cell cycle sensor histidine kinase PleC